MTERYLTMGDLRKMAANPEYPDDMRIGYRNGNGEGGFIICTRTIRGLITYSNGKTFFVDPESYLENPELYDKMGEGKDAWKVEVQDPPILLFSDEDIPKSVT